MVRYAQTPLSACNDRNVELIMMGGTLVTYHPPLGSGSEIRNTISDSQRPSHSEQGLYDTNTIITTYYYITLTTVEMLALLESSRKKIGPFLVL